jgi:hypothetical protein
MSTNVSPITRDTPLRLALAAEIAFPQGGVTAASLRAEAKRGRLAIERIAGKDFTTLSAIDEMRERCRSIPREPAYGSDQRGEAKRHPHTSSATAIGKSARDSLRLSLSKLRKHSLTT